MNKLIYVVASFVMLETSPALAAPAMHRHLARNAHAQMRIPTQPGQYQSQADPCDVYVDGHYAGRACDPNIRESLKQEYYDFRGGA